MLSLTMLCQPVFGINFAINSAQCSGRSQVQQRYTQMQSMMRPKVSDYELYEVQIPGLFKVVIDGELDVLQILINYGADINARDSRGNTLLHYACKTGHLPIVEYLIVQRNMSPNIQNQQDKTPLHWACWNGHLPIVEFLISQGADISVKDENGWTPLKAAQESYHLDIVKYLRSYTIANCGIRLIAAAEKGDLQMVIFWTEEGYVDPNVRDSHGRTPMHYACKKGHWSIIRYLISRGARVPVYAQRRIICSACMYGYLDIVKYLISQGANVNATDEKGRTLLHIACEQGNLPIIELLISKDADISVKDENGCTPLKVAQKFDYSDIVEYLRSYITVNGDKQLIEAAKKGNLQAVKFWIEEGHVAPNVHDGDGRTPLHYACEQGYLPIVELLISSGANISVKDKNGCTPFKVARESGHSNIAVYLRSYITVNGDKKLIEAAKKGNLQMMTFWIEKRCVKPNVHDGDGRTPLHYACMKKNRKIVDYLINQGADINAKDSNGYTPFDVAQESGHSDIVECLRSQMENQQ